MVNPNGSGFNKATRYATAVMFGGAGGESNPASSERIAIELSYRRSRCLVLASLSGNGIPIRVPALLAFAELTRRLFGASRFCMTLIPLAKRAESPVENQRLTRPAAARTGCRSAWRLRRSRLFTWFAANHGLLLGNVSSCRFLSSPRATGRRGQRPVV